MKIAFINDSSQRLGVQYLGVQHISAVLKESGHQPRLFLDPQLFNDSHCSIKALSAKFDYKKEIIDQLKEYRPGLIGFSVVTDFYRRACDLAEEIKKEIDVPIIFGGVHPSLVPERVIKNDFVDIVCVGEGEYPMLELAESLDKGRLDYKIRNLWFKKDGKIIKNELRPLIADLDKLPFPDQELYHEWKKCLKKSYYIGTSRGCPNACSYCLHSYFHKLYRDKGVYVRRRSVRNVTDELVLAKRIYGVRQVFFTDDCFGMDRTWLGEFSREYREKVGVPFACIMQPRDVTADTVSKLKHSGCCLVFLGIQSWDREIRETMLDRWTKDSEMEEAIHLLKEAGIEVVVDNLIGLPGQDNERLLVSNLRYTRLRPNRIFFFQLRYYPGTTIVDKALEKGMISADFHEKILNGEDEGGVCVKGLFSKKDPERAGFDKIKMFLFSMDVLPGRLIDFIAKKRLYRFWPSFIDTSIFMLFRTLFSRDLDSRIRFEEAVFKYTYFMRKKISGLFRRRNRRAV